MAQLTSSQTKSMADVGGIQAGWPRIREQLQLVGDEPFRMVGDVHVFEDGVEQPGATLEKEDQPASIFIMIDVSTSMRGSAVDAIAAAQKLVAESDPADEIGIVSFGWQAFLELPFTTDRASLDETLRGIKFVQSSTAMFDAVEATVKQFASEGAKYRRVVVVISDGQDVSSKLSLSKLLKGLRSVDAPVIDTVSPGSQVWNGEKTVEAISKATGGLEFHAHDAVSLSDKAAEASQDVHSRYRLEYGSTHTQRDGKLHKIDVKLEPVAGASKPKVVFRQEYYAPLQ
jgi:Ca-activated chloride channel homolog